MRISLHPVAQPECRLPFLNNRTVFLAQHRALAAMNISSHGRDSRLFLIDVDTLEATTLPVPDRQWGPYGLAGGVDGRLYVGFFGGRIYAVDVGERRFHLLADPFAKSQPERLTWGGTATRAGKVYMGVYPTGEFTELDTASGRWRTIAPLPEGTQGVYASQFVEVAGGRVLVNLYGARGELLLYNPASGEIEARHPFATAEEQPRARSLVALDAERVLYSTERELKVFNTRRFEREADFLAPCPEPMTDISPTPGGLFATGLASGQLYHLGRGGCEPVETGLQQGNRPSGGVHQIGEETFLTLGDNGQVATFSRTRGALASAQLPNGSTTGMKIHMLHWEPGAEFVVGAHFISSQMFRADLAGGRVEPSLHKVVEKSGQITCATQLGEVVYTSVYGGALVLAYRPDKPFAYGENPRLLCKPGERQNRPVALCHDARLLYMATRADYGHLGGAICVVDPASGACEVYRHFVRGQNPVSVYPHGDLLVGTTEIRGDQGSCLPEATRAVVFAWSTTRRELVHTWVPWESESLSALGISPGGRLLGFAPGRMFLYDAVAQKGTVREWPHGVPGSGVFLEEGCFLAMLPEEGALRVDLESGEATPVSPPVRGVRLFGRLGPTELLATQEDATLVRISLHDY